MVNSNAPVIILVRPQIAENIGAAARAMVNFNATDLRLVQPNEYDPNHAFRMACDGRKVLDQMQCFDSLEAALKDITFSVATTRRLRRVKIAPLTPNETANKLHRLPAGPLAALVFGAERTGLSNEEVFLCDTSSSIPTGLQGSLNLGQAVLLYLYEWFQSSAASLKKDDPHLRLATHEEKERVYKIIGKLLEQSDYQPRPRLPEFMRRLKYLFEDYPMNHRKNQILLKFLRYMEKLAEN